MQISLTTLIAAGCILLSSFLAAAAQTKQVLWDFRRVERYPAKVSVAENRTVLAYLFGKRIPRGVSVTAKLNGSFTAARRKETLYYVEGCDEDGSFKSDANCAHASWANAGKVAIYTGTTPILKADGALGTSLIKATDVNNDGVNEVLSLTGYSGQGYTIQTGILSEIAGNEVRQTKTFDGAHDSCGVGERSDRQFAEVVSYLPSPGVPKFAEEYYQGSCGDTPNWKKISKKLFDETAQ